jgi:hypothetical protein
MINLSSCGLLLLILILPPVVRAQDINQFNNLLIQCDMSLTIPDGFIECPVIPNKDMEYEYALKYPDVPFEIRYTIRPISYKFYPNDSVKAVMESQKQYRNTAYLILLKSIIMNLSGGMGVQITEFDPATVRQEFHADWGATAFLQLNSDFGKEYDYCMIVAIHKKDVADAYYFYLSTFRENFRSYAHPFFYSLVFD